MTATNTPKAIMLRSHRDVALPYDATVELPMRDFLVYGERLAALTQGTGALIGEPKLTRWAEVRRADRR